VLLLSDLAFCGTSWVSWAGGALVNLGDCRHLAGPEFVGSLSGFGYCCWLLLIDCEGFLCLFPMGDTRKATLEKSWYKRCSLVWFLRRPSEGLTCDAN
jgi:hypothetical protein